MASCAIWQSPEFCFGNVSFPVKWFTAPWVKGILLFPEVQSCLLSLSLSKGSARFCCCSEVMGSSRSFHQRQAWSSNSTGSSWVWAETRGKLCHWGKQRVHLGGCLKTRERERDEAWVKPKGAWLSPVLRRGLRCLHFAAGHQVFLLRVFQTRSSKWLNWRSQSCDCC